MSATRTDAPTATPPDGARTAEPAGRLGPAGHLGPSAAAGAPPAAPRRSHARALLPPVRRAWWRDAVAALVGGHLALVTLLWATADGLDVSTTAALATSAGRLLGLWASALLLVQVLGMARVPWVERAVGQDRLSAWHRWAGFTSFWMLVAHLVLVTVGYAASDGRGVVGELVQLVLTLPGMLLAAAGTALLVAVVGLSVRAARRRLRYESWHLLHLYAYLGVGLALPHQLWTGTSFLLHPWAATYWWALYGVTFVSVVVFRLVRPLALSLRHDLRVAAVLPDAPGLVSVVVRGRDLHRLRAEAGQFFVWRFRTGAGWTRAHPLSLSAVPRTDGLRVTMDVTGDDGARVAAARPGTRVIVEGPFGRVTPSSRRHARLAAFAAGAGVAPVVGLLEHGAAHPGVDTLVLRHRDDADLPLREDVDALVRHAGVRFLDLPGPRSRTGTPWLPAHLGHHAGPAALHQLVPDLLDHDVVVCGPPAWTAALVADLRTAGVARSAIHVESYVW
ncbi:ferredoxin reductase family protein [Cellulomonas iranensis]|uniref:ferredoxin reductase family protein n=1 Tax=Cellulomonas iranensis TaxID=76862 RepID=UPI000B3CAF3B|nr:ferric reductase-like transmembrane domain-containing protein [Cellulomonas iranensis]